MLRSHQDSRRLRKKQKLAVQRRKSFVFCILTPLSPTGRVYIRNDNWFLHQVLVSFHLNSIYFSYSILEKILCYVGFQNTKLFWATDFCVLAGLRRKVSTSPGTSCHAEQHIETALEIEASPAKTQNYFRSPIRVSQQVYDARFGHLRAPLAMRNIILRRRSKLRYPPLKHNIILGR